MGKSHAYSHVSSSTTSKYFKRLSTRVFFKNAQIPASEVSLHAAFVSSPASSKNQGRDSYPSRVFETLYHPDFSPLSLPLYNSCVQAGFPSPADDSVDRHLDLNEHLIPRPAATFFVRASGDSMIDVGIHCGDILIVDRSLTPRHNHIVIAILNAELTVKRLYHRDGKVQLLAENTHYPPIHLSPDATLDIWGVVTSVIHQFKSPA